MTRYSASWLLALTALWAGPGHAAAQDAGVAGSSAVSGGTSSGAGNLGNISIRMLKVGEREYNDLTYSVPVGSAACGEDGNVTIQLTNLPADSRYQYLEAWYATGDGNCNNSDRATRLPDTKNCTKIPIEASAQRINARRFYDFKVYTKDICNGDGTKQLYLLALTGQNTSETTMQFATLSFTLDTNPPDPPSNVQGNSGQTQIPVTWTVPAERGYYYWVLLDTNAVAGSGDADAGDNPDCYSSFLRAGTAFDPWTSQLPEGVQMKFSDGQTSSEVFNGDDLDTPLAAATVIAADQAGNPSLESEVVCLNVVKTSGWYDRYKAAGGTVEPGCACSVPGATLRSRGLTAVTVIPVLTLLAFACSRWRRIRRRAR